MWYFSLGYLKLKSICIQFTQMPFKKKKKKKKKKHESISSPLSYKQNSIADWVF